MKTELQDNRSPDVQKLAELIKGIKIAMLTTVEQGGALRSRPMATQEVAIDGDLWFFTQVDSPKADEVRRDAHVNVAFADPSAHRYVSVSGTAHVVRDAAKAKELWSPAYKLWFPKGLEDPSLALLRVVIDQAEYWDAPSSAMVYLVGFLTSAVTGQRSQSPGSEHKKIVFNS